MQIASRADHPLHELFDRAFSGLASDLVDAVVSTPRLERMFIGLDISPDSRWGQVEILATLLDHAVYEIRSDLLMSQSSRPAPFDHPALADVERTSESLVALAHFDTSIGGLARKGFVFQVAPALPDLLSQYWATQNLLALPPSDVFVRLDPLIVEPQSEYRATVAKMYLHGRSLDWERICSLKNREFARWLPDDADSDVRFTDVIWERRDDGVHFECEEVPAIARTRAARYFHSIFNPTTRLFTHTDFAARYYSEEELGTRHDRHLKDLGKIGIRVKLFRTDTPLPVDFWGDLVVSAFVWNDDIKDYFRARRNLDSELRGPS